MIWSETTKFKISAQFINHKLRNQSLKNQSAILFLLHVFFFPLSKFPPRWIIKQLRSFLNTDPKWLPRTVCYGRNDFILWALIYSCCQWRPDWTVWEWLSKWQEDMCVSCLLSVENWKAETRETLMTFLQRAESHWIHLGTWRIRYTRRTVMSNGLR